VIPPLHEFDPTAVKSFDDLVALEGIYGHDAVYNWLGSLSHSNDDETVGAEPKALISPAKEQDDETYVKVRTILGAIPSRLEVEQCSEPDDAPPVFYSQEHDSFMQEDFKCYYQTPDKDPTSSSNRTLLRLLLHGDSDDDSGSDDDGSYRETAVYFERSGFLCGLAHRPPPNRPGPSLVMNVLFISGAHLSRPLAYEAGVLKKALYIFMVIIQNRQKFLDKVGFGNDFDGSLLDEEAAGYAFWFEQRPIDEIATGLRHFGDKRPADCLEDWKRGPGDELEGRIQAVLREERLAAFRKLVDLLLRLDPDKKPPTHSLDDSFLWLLDRRYLGRWWASCSDDLGLDDKVVYKPEIEPADVPMVVPAGEPAGEPEGNLPKKKRTGRTTRSGGARRHGRPPGSQTLPPCCCAATICDHLQGFNHAPCGGFRS
jgi:hypothetical protein